jgi:hypothetical protein
VVHVIVIVHGGQITVASTPGRGTRFDILFLIHRRRWSPMLVTWAERHAQSAVSLHEPASKSFVA